MSVHLTKLQGQLCNLLQKGLPICSNPFAQIAKEMGCDEDTVLKQTSELKKTGVIRRITAIINHRTLGMAGTLVAAHIPQDNLLEVAKAVNAIENVSHNYLRKHYYNLWFTLQAKSAQQIEEILLNLSARFKIDFYSLPAEHIFKLDVRFDAENAAQLFSDVEEMPKYKTAVLDENEKLILSKLQIDLQIVKNPFDFLSSRQLQMEDVFKILSRLLDVGAIRRIAAVVDHRKLGFVANVLFVCKVPEKQIIQAGRKLSQFELVSHCYQRKTFDGWHYNLFAMMHGKSMAEIQQTIDSFVESEKIDTFELLPTAAELKKQPVKFQFY